MGGEIEEAEVDVLGRQVELLPHRAPATRIQRQRHRGPEPFGERHGGRQGTRRGGERSSYKEAAAGEGHNGPRRWLVASG